MAVPTTMDPGSWLVKHLETEDGDLLREMIKTFAEALMSAEAQAICGAGYGEVSAERTNSRNGYRPREFDTRAGTIELAVPKLRKDSYYPGWLLTPPPSGRAGADPGGGSVLHRGGLDPAGG